MRFTGHGRSAAARTVDRHTSPVKFGTVDEVNVKASAATTAAMATTRPRALRVFPPKALTG